MAKTVLNTSVGGRDIYKALKSGLSTKEQRLSDAESAPPSKSNS